MTILPETCPKCQSDLRGDEIPEKYRDEYYGGKTHYSRIIGITDMRMDRTVMWKCPDCGHEWRRE